MKIKKFALLALFPFLCLCGCNASENAFNKKQISYVTRGTGSIISDPAFSHGFIVNSPESTHNGRTWYFDYNGAANKSASPSWTLAPWWDPFNFGLTAKYSKSGNVHTYTDASRSFAVDTSTGAFSMTCDTRKEYLYRFGEDIPSGASWNNMLLMQSFGSKSTYVSDMSSCKVKMTFTLNDAHYTGNNFRPTGNECIQFLFYLRLYHTPRDGSASKPFGMWLGVPLYDSRYTTIPEHVVYDGGFEGATGSVIYSLPSSLYLGSDALVINKEYSFEVDVLSYIQKAYQFCVDHSYVKTSDVKYSNINIIYFNIGFEIPGGFFETKATVSYLDIMCN